MKHSVPCKSPETADMVFANCPVVWFPEGYVHGWGKVSAHLTHWFVYFEFSLIFDL